MRAELVRVFGEGLAFDVATRPHSPASGRAAVIALGVTLALSIVGLIVAVGLIFR